MKTTIRYGLALLLAVMTLGTLSVTTAEAHTGDLIVTGSCNPETGRYDIKPRLTLTQSDLSGVFRSRVGTSTFQGTPTNADGMSNPTAFSGPGTYNLPTFSLPGDTKGLGPWVYAFTRWSDGYSKGSDGQMRTPLAGDCVKWLPMDAKANVTFTQPTCKAPGRLVYGQVANATLSGTPDGTTGPADFSVTATATPGHVFDDGTSDGSPTLTFTGHIDGKRTDQACFVQPADVKRERTRTSAPNCTTRTVTTVTEESTGHYVWDGTEYVVQWSPWTKASSSSHHATDTQCPRKAIRGGYDKVDKCGTSGDLLRLDIAYGGEYVVDGKVRAEGKWFRAPDRSVNITLRATRPDVKIDGRAYWHVTFDSRACPTNPGPSPHTGARQVA
jgi:hypothetical protein